MALCRKIGREHLLYLPLKDQQRSHHKKRNWRVNSPQVCSNCTAKIKHWPPHEGWTFKMLSTSNELHPSCSCWKLQSWKYPSTDTELNWALDSIWILITWMHLELKHTNKPRGQKRLKQDLFQRSLLNFATEWSYQNRKWSELILLNILMWCWRVLSRYSDIILDSAAFKLILYHLNDWVDEQLIKLYTI